MDTSETEMPDVEERVLDQSLSPYITAIEDELRRHMDPSNKLLSLAYDFVGSGGKRLRPAVALLVCDSVSGSFRDALPIAAAYELAHAASLTQDDIIDNSLTRHNKPTPHAVYGVTTAILLSDVMIFDMFDRLAEYIATV